MVHGDGFVTVGSRTDPTWFEDELKKRFEIKTKKIGLGGGENKEESILNRIVRCTPNGFELEADPRHADIIIQAMNMGDAKGVTSAGEEAKSWEADEIEELLDTGLAK